MSRYPRFLVLLAAWSALSMPGFAQTLYWDSARPFTAQKVSSSSSVAGPSLLVLAWQETQARAIGGGDIFLSIATSPDGVAWTTRSRLIGPIHYTNATLGEGSQPRVYSLVVDRDDRILVAVTVSDRETVIMQSTDRGATFQQVQRLSSRSAIGVPNLSTTNGGGFLLLLSQGSASAAGQTGSVTLAYSHSRDGRAWSEIAPFVTPADGAGVQQLQPSHATFLGQEFVVFESLMVRTDLTSTWQLFVKKSRDGGAAWDNAVPLTSSRTVVGGKAVFGDEPLDFDNQRPRLAALPSDLALVWERSTFGSSQTQIWSARLASNGALAGAPEVVSVDKPSRFAHVLLARETEYVLYADASTGTSKIVLAHKERGWQVQPLANVEVRAGAAALDALFPHAVQFKDSLFVFWENWQKKAAPAVLAGDLIRLPPVTSVGVPVVKPVDFVPGQPAARDAVTVEWSAPVEPDASGIKEYRFTWAFTDGTTTVEDKARTVSVLTGAPRTLSSTRKVDRDGTWTFSVVAEDVAGNVSATPATVSFTRDATPPAAVSFEVLRPDGSVLLDAPPEPPDRRDANSRAVDTNTFTVRWVPGGDKDIVGYTYNLQPGWATLADYQQSAVALVTPPPRVVTTSTDLVFDNRDNGVYVLTVQAIDRAGNLSPASTLALQLSSYQLVTRVDRVIASQPDELGKVRVTILGRGFVENGQVAKIYLDRGHRGPRWDIQLDPASPITIDDRQISGIVLDDTNESGEYRVGLLQKRPSGEDALYFTTRTFAFSSPGTVKIGNFEIALPNWIARPSTQYVVSFDALLVVLIVALLATLSVFAFRKVVALAVEGAAVRTEVVALLAGRPNARWEERKKRMQALKRKGMGLRLKFMLLMVTLVTMIVLGVSIPLGFQLVSTQRTSLVTGLRNNASILLGALASSAEAQVRLKDDGLANAQAMLSLTSTMSDAVYTTITGPDRNYRPTDPKDFVWASNEKRFDDEYKAGKLNRAAETVNDELAKTVVPDLQKKIDSDAAASLKSLVDDYRSLKGRQSDLRTKTDAASRVQLAGVNEQLSQKARDIDSKAKDLYEHPATLEVFDPNRRLLPTYLFYQPVVFYNRADNVADTTFYQGMIRLQVKTDTINAKIEESIRTILTTASAIALGAILLGIIGAFFMARLTVTPIRLVAAGVKHISDTEDKELLKDHNIVVRTRDEIRELADNVNDMTHGLVKAAMANKLLLEGSDVQKRFLPLVKDRMSGEDNIEEQNNRLEISGYYKGAKGVSGDYFDFKRLDDTYYALIKCDVSGKGVAAALIMVEVATLFINYFREWPKRKEDINALKDPKAKARALKELERLDKLVYTINDMVEERGFAGKFAAFTLCLYNSATGVVNICNAGDTVVNIFSAEKGVMEHSSLPSSPAAGSIPSMLVEMKSPYKQVERVLHPGDVLFLQTDGFEESRRMLVGPDFTVIKCEEPGLADGDDHLGTHDRGKDYEEFRNPRFDGIVNAVFNRGQYVLKRSHNPIPDEQLVFDFSTCTGTVKEAVLALVSVEKIFRMVPNPGLGAESKVTMETRVAGFLKEHFLQFDKYFSHGGESVKGVTTFSHALEEDQYDDLTIIALKRK